MHYDVIWLAYFKEKTFFSRNLTINIKEKKKTQIIRDLSMENIYLEIKSPRCHAYCRALHHKLHIS